MSSNLAFLLAAVGLSVLGVLALWAVQNRPRRRTSSIDEYRQRLEALAPHDARDPGVSVVRPREIDPRED